jgi:glutaredoxin
VRAVTGRATVPQVFMAGRLVGGADELEAFLKDQAK